MINYSLIYNNLAVNQNIICFDFTTLNTKYEIDQQCIAKTPEGDVVVQSLIDITFLIQGEEVETGIILLTAIS